MQVYFIGFILETNLIADETRVWGFSKSGGGFLLVMKTVVVVLPPPT
jgi:hypothetical protein